MANSEHADQTAPVGAVLSGSAHRNLYLSQKYSKKPEKPKFKVFEPKTRRNETQKFHFWGLIGLILLIQYSGLIQCHRNSNKSS